MAVVKQPQSKDVTIWGESTIALSPILLLTQCLSAEEPTQITFWWLHDLLQVCSLPSTRHWSRPHSPIQGCSPVFWVADAELALALLRAVFLHVLAPTRSAAGHSQCCKHTITLMPRWLEWGGPQPATPSLSQGTPYSTGTITSCFWSWLLWWWMIKQKQNAEFKSCQYNTKQPKYQLHAAFLLRHQSF